MKKQIAAALSLVKSKKGQQTVEFVLMLGVIVSVVLAVLVSFHKELAGGFFSIIGSILN